jgi:hypothetical protein
MLDYRSTIAGAAVMGSLLVGCSDPDLPTDLRTSGPPNVTAVTVMSDLESASDPNRVGLGRILETATFCRLGDDKRPSLVGLPDIRVIQVCPADLSKPADDVGTAEAIPPAWFVRVVFDQLLDPNIEDLETGPDGGPIGTLKNTQPVVLTCNGVNIDYGGDYVPNGNKQSWPLGPALFISPVDPTSVPTGASCTVTLKDNIHSKAGVSVPMDQRTYQFKIGDMAFRFSDPNPEDASDGSIVLGLTTSAEFFFTAPLTQVRTIETPNPDPDPMAKPFHVAVADLDPAKVILSSGPNLNISDANPDGDPNPDVCAGNGAAVDPLTIRVSVKSVDPLELAGDQLVLQVDVAGETADPKAQVWAPNTTYLLQFTDDAVVTPLQGGATAQLPGAQDFTLCFHTPAAPPPAAR